MVAQSDWLPMMIATSARLSAIEHPVNLSGGINGKDGPPQAGDGTAKQGLRSGDNVGSDLVFKLDELVFDDELLLLHSLDTKLVTPNLDHCLYGGIEIQMLLF
jgi:hypothetical protein